MQANELIPSRQEIEMLVCEACGCSLHDNPSCTFTSCHTKQTVTNKIIALFQTVARNEALWLDKWDDRMFATDGNCRDDLFNHISDLGKAGNDIAFGKPGAGRKSGI